MVGIYHGVFIFFLTEEDGVKGFYLMATRSCINSFPGEVYQVPREALPLLDSEQIGYRRATDDEIRQSEEARRSFFKGRIP